MKFMFIYVQKNSNSVVMQFVLPQRSRFTENLFVSFNLLDSVSIMKISEAQREGFSTKEA